MLGYEKLGAAVASLRSRRGRRPKGGRRAFSPAALAAATSHPQGVSLVVQERGEFEIAHAAADCEPNVTFGGLFNEERPYLWTARGCRGIFRCAGSVLRCGIFVRYDYKLMLKALKSGEGKMTICSCDRTESMQALRHFRDGRDHPANAARQLVVTYREATGFEGRVASAA